MALRKQHHHHQRPREPRSYASLIRLLSCKKPRAYDPSLLLLDEVLVLARKWAALHQMSYYYDPDTLRAWARATRWMAHNREVVRRWLPDIQERAPRFFELQERRGEDGEEKEEEDIGRAFEEYLAATAGDAGRLVPEDEDLGAGREDADRRTLEGRQQDEMERDNKRQVVIEVSEVHHDADGDWIANEIVVGGVKDGDVKEEEEPGQEHEVEEDVQSVVLCGGELEVESGDVMMVEDGGLADGESREMGDEHGVKVHDGDRAMEDNEAPVDDDRQEAVEGAGEPNEVAMVDTSTEVDTTEVETAEVRQQNEESTPKDVVKEKMGAEESSHIEPIHPTTYPHIPMELDLTADTDVLDASEILCGISHSPTRDNHDEECAATLAAFKTSQRVSVDYKEFRRSHHNAPHPPPAMWATPAPLQSLRPKPAGDAWRGLRPGKALHVS